MAKATSKVSVKAPKAPAKIEKKKAAPKKAGASANPIVKACETALSKLNELNIEHAFQSEINWCLGSFQNDQNPVGLYQMAERSVIILKGELAKKTKGITAKLIADIEKALKA